MSDGSKVPGTSKETLLENELRRGIYEIIEKRPGLNKNQLADELDTYPTQVTYHVDRLVVNGVLEEVPVAQGREMLLFLPSQEELWQNEQTRILFGRAPLREVALYVAEHPGATSKQMAAVLDVTPATIRHHLRRLREQSLVQRIQSDKKTSYHPTQALEAWVDQIGHAYKLPWNSSTDEA